MKLIRGLHNLNSPLMGSVLTLGNFDGVHLGHQCLVETLIAKARELNLPSVVITFEPQPKEFFEKKQTVPRLMRLSEKYLALKKLGIDYLCVLYFDKALSQISAEDFIRSILRDKFGMRAIIIGHDFRFGYQRLGDFNLLQKMSDSNGFQVVSKDPVMLHGKAVSSTWLRIALQEGNMALALLLLGRYYRLRGKVTYGSARGRELGFPTANINLHRELVPIRGVFVVRAQVNGKTYNGVANVGIRPTFYGQRILLEVHLFDFNRSIYGNNLEVEFLNKLRNEKIFDHFEGLVKQIHKDVTDAKQYLASHVIKDYQT